MKIEDCFVGQRVRWSDFDAEVLGVGSERVFLRFSNGEEGTRLPEDLEPLPKFKRGQDVRATYKNGLSGVFLEARGDRCFYAVSDKSAANGWSVIWDHCHRLEPVE